MNRNVFDLVICSALAAVAMTMALLAPEIDPARAILRCRWYCLCRATRLSRRPFRAAGWE